MSGKTTLAKKIIAKSNRPCIVLDPNFDPEWQTDYIYDDKEKFLEIVKYNQSCDLVIDESGETIGRYAREMAFLATRSRHYGHRAFFITQRAQMLDRNVRDQCTNIFLFSVAPSDAKIFAEDFVDDLFLEAPTLARGECIAKKRFSPARKINVFDM